MKFKHLTLSLGFLALIVWVGTHFLTSTYTSETGDIPVPTETKVLNKHDSEDDEWKEILEREKWMDEMHKAAPDIDWKQANQAIRNRQYVQKSKSTVRLAEETLANGNLTGTWTERGSSNQSGRIVYADYDAANQFIYAATDGGHVFKGTKNGGNWTSINEKLNFGDIDHVAVLRQQTNPRIFVAANKYCFYSDDDGATWNQSTGIDNVQSWGDIQKAVVIDNQGNEKIYLLIQEWNYQNWGEIISIYQSTDLGNSFTKLYSVRRNQSGPAPMHDIWADRYSDTSIYYLQREEIFEVANSTPQLVGTVNVSVSSSSLLTGSHANGNLNMYVFIDQDIYYSTDLTNWSLQSNVGRNPFRRNSFAASYSDEQAAFIGGVNCARSNDAFTSWSEVNQWYDYYGNEATMLHADIPAVIPFKDENGDFQLFVCTDGGLYRSNDNLQTVENISLHGLNASQYYDVYTNRNNLDYIYAGAQDQGFQLASQDTADILGFDQTVSGDYAHIVSTDSGQSIWFEYPGFVAFKQDATTGDAWTISGDFNGRDDYWLPPLREHPTNNLKAYMAGVDGSGAVIYELDATALSGDVQYSVATSNLSTVFGAGKISSFCYSPIQTNYWYALTNEGEMIYSTDNMSTWTLGGLNNGPEDHYFHGASVYASKSKLGRVFAAGSGYSNPGVWVSEDHGVTWQELTNGLPSTLTYMITATPDDSLLFAATDVGPYVFVAKDSAWYNLSGNSTPDVTYWSVEWINQSQTARFGTYGRGIWDFAIAKTDTVPTDTTSSIEPRKVNAPVRLYPNPAQNHLFIDFGDNSTQEFSIYTIDGQLVEQVKTSNLQETYDLTVSHLPVGTYILSGTSEGKPFHQRFVISR